MTQPPLDLAAIRERVRQAKLPHLVRRWAALRRSVVLSAEEATALLDRVEALQEENAKAAERIRQLVDWSNRCEENRLGFKDSLEKPEARVAALQAENAALAKRLRGACEQLAQAEQWKSEQLHVESEWDVQAVGQMLQIPIGHSIRKGIAPAIEAMQGQIANLVDQLVQAEQEHFGDLRADLTAANQTIADLRKVLEGIKRDVPAIMTNGAVGPAVIAGIDKALARLDGNGGGE